MGNDGGSIPDRRDLVRNKPKVRIIVYLGLVVLESQLTSAGRTSG